MVGVGLVVPSVVLRAWGGQEGAALEQGPFLAVDRVLTVGEGVVIQAHQLPCWHAEPLVHLRHAVNIWTHICKVYAIWWQQMSSLRSLLDASKLIYFGMTANTMPAKSSRSIEVVLSGMRGHLPVHARVTTKGYIMIR